MSGNASPIRSLRADIVSSATAEVLLDSKTKEGLASQYSSSISSSTSTENISAALPIPDPKKTSTNPQAFNETALIPFRRVSKEEADSNIAQTNNISLESTQSLFLETALDPNKALLHVPSEEVFDLQDNQRKGLLAATPMSEKASQSTLSIQVKESTVNQLQALDTTNSSSLKLELKNSQLTETELALLAAKCPNLRELVLDNCDFLTDETAKFIAAAWPNLESISIISNTKITIIGIEALISSPSLRKIYVDNESVQSRVTATQARQLHSKIPGIETVIVPLSGKGYFFSIDLKMRKPSLDTTSLSPQKQTELFLEEAQSKDPLIDTEQDLISLHQKYPAVNVDIYPRLHFPATRLCLGNEKTKLLSSLVQLGCFPHLQELLFLDGEDDIFPNESIRIMFDVGRKLTGLTLIGLRTLPAEIFIAVKSYCPNVKKLHVDMSHLHEEDLLDLCPPKLESLLVENPRFTKEGIEQLSQKCQIKRLYIEKSGTFDETQAEIIVKHLIHLKKLVIKDNDKLTPQGILILSRHPKLRHLVVNNRNVANSQLNYTTISSLPLPPHSLSTEVTFDMPYDKRHVNIAFKHKKSQDPFDEKSNDAYYL